MFVERKTPVTTVENELNIDQRQLFEPLYFQALLSLK
jgi:hypothetical protein